MTIDNKILKWTWTKLKTTPECCIFPIEIILTNELKQFFAVTTLKSYIIITPYLQKHIVIVDILAYMIHFETQIEVSFGPRCCKEKLSKSKEVLYPSFISSHPFLWNFAWVESPEDQFGDGCYPMLSNSSKTCPDKI